MKLNLLREIIGLLGIKVERLEGEDDFLFQYVLNVETHFMSYVNEYNEELSSGIQTKAMKEKEQDLLIELEGVIESFDKDDDICMQLKQIIIALKTEGKSRDEEIEL